MNYSNYSNFFPNNIEEYGRKIFKADKVHVCRGLQ